MSGKKYKTATHRKALIFSQIEELRRRGLNQTEIADMHGVSRQAVSQQKIKYGGVKTTRQIVNEAWPWTTTGLHGKSAAYQRLRDHGEFIVSGGREMSEYKLGRHAAWLKMMRRNDYVPSSTRTSRLHLAWHQQEDSPTASAIRKPMGSTC